MFSCDVIKQLNMVQAFLKSHRKTQYWSRIAAVGREVPGTPQGPWRWFPPLLRPFGGTSLLSLAEENESQEILTEPAALRPWQRRYCYLWDRSVISRMRQMHNHFENRSLGHGEQETVSTRALEPWQKNSTNHYAVQR